MSHIKSAFEGGATVNGNPLQDSCPKDLATGKVTPITLPKSDVLQFFTESGSKITIRPSGTEPKIKFYFGMKGDTTNGLDAAIKTLDTKLEQAAKELTE